MDDFIQKYNDENFTSQFDVNEPLTKFVGDPRNLPLAARQELVYRFQFLEETVSTLASTYRLTPIALEEWLDENEVEIQRLETEEDVANFEAHVNAQYKDLRVRLSGLVALHTARAWESLAVSSEHLLASLEYATQQAHANAKNGLVEVKALKSLVDAHSKLTEKHQLIKQAIEVPADRDLKSVVDGFQKSLEDLFNEIDGSSYELPSQAKDNKSS